MKKFSCFVVTVFSIAVVGVFIGCESAPRAEPPKPQHVFSVNVHYGVPPDSISLYMAGMISSYDRMPPLSDTEKDDAVPDWVKKEFACTELSRIISSKANWMEADAYARRMLADWSNRPGLGEVSNSAAHAILWHHIISDTVSAERQKVAAHYTTILLEEANPDAELMARALVYLQQKRYWSDAQIAEAAAVARLAAGEFRRKEDSKLSAGPPEKRPRFDSTRWAKWERIRSAIAVLDSLRRLGKGKDGETDGIGV